MHRLLLLLSLFAIVLAGCSGAKSDSGGTSDSTVPEDFMTAFRNAVETRNRDVINSRVSSDYINNCLNRTQFVNEIMDTLGNGGTIQFNTLPISGKNVNNFRGTARFNGGFELIVTQQQGENTITREMRREGTMHLRAENGIWKFFGNQSCP